MSPFNIQRQFIAVAYVVALQCLWCPAASAQDTLDVVLERASVYAGQFRRQLSNLVAEETYVQDVRNAIGVNVTSGTHNEPVKHRELRSDLLMIRPAQRYVEFRDVFEVDGKVVRDRQNRLADLFLSGKDNTEQVEKVAAESARFNIGTVFRNFNTPTLALVFLEPETRGRFRFRKVEANRMPTLGRDWKLELPGGIGSAERLWAVEYREVQRQTLISRYGSGGDMPATGKFWIDAPTGRVLATELVVGDPLTQCTIDVRYAGEQINGLSVPAEMRERYVNNRDRLTTLGTATYGRVRVFGVSVEEDIPPVDKKKPR